MTKKLILIFSVIILFAWLNGCTDRGTNLTEPFAPRTVNYVDWITWHLFAEDLGLSMFTSVKDAPIIKFKPYTPPNFDTGGNNKPFPTLYLLPPYGKTEDYYFNHGLVAVADKMIAEGTIKPMIIVCIDGSSGYGGICYGDTYAGGKYAKAIGSIENDGISGTLIDYMYSVFNSDSASDGSGRAISGFGLGGYGAFKIAAKYSENFSAVSAVSAPLDFDGAGGTGGLRTLFTDVVNSLGGGVIPHAQYKTLDSTDHAALGMLISMACSFTPYVDYDTMLWNDDMEFWANDTTYFPDTATLIHPGGNVRCIMPFDSTGAVYDTVWNLWLDNNISSLIDDYPNAFDGKYIKLFMAADQGFGFNEQTRSFADYLGTYLGQSIDTLVYDGYEDFRGTTDNFIYDMLPALLKFHSDHFPDYD